MTYTFETIDKTGRKIHLSNERLTHITITHNEITNYLDELKRTIENPLKIIEQERGNLRKYFSYQKHRKHPEKYLRIIVKYLNNHGFVLTAQFVRNIK
jgi:hypothetical protein